MTMLALRRRTAALFTRIYGGRLPPSPTRRFGRGSPTMRPLEECKLAGEDPGAVQVQEALAAFRAKCPTRPMRSGGRIHQAVRGAGQASRAALGVGLRVRRGLAVPAQHASRCGEAYRSAGYQAMATRMRPTITLRPESTSGERCQNAPKPPMKRGDEDAFRLLISKQVYFGHT